MGLDFHEGGTEAYYRPSSDSITMPPDTYFKDDYGYMSTFLHECGHATGHESRLNRDLTGRFGSPEYAKEELRAEIASAFTAQDLGFGVSPDGLTLALDNHKAYIQSWISVIEDQPNELFAAIKDAEKISDYLLEKGEFIQDKDFRGLKIDKNQPDTYDKPKGENKLSLDFQISSAMERSLKSYNVSYVEPYSR